MIFNYASKIFDTDLLVCVGSNIKQLTAFADKHGTKNFKKLVREKDFIKNFNKTYTTAGFVYKYDYLGIPYFVLWLKEYKNDWKDLDTLLHEIVHYKQFEFENSRIKKEIEFEAYFIKSTFRELRRELNKRLKL